jgi:starvation-inducible outer membrane lipoprotein
MYPFACRVFEVCLIAVFIALLTGCNSVPQRTKNEYERSKNGDDKPQVREQFCLMLPIGQTESGALAVRMVCKNDE